MPIDAKAVRTAIVCLSTLLPNGVHADGIDTEHIFGFMIGSDVGNVGERELQSETTGSFSKSGGRYRAIGQEFELEFVPVRNFGIAANWPGKVFPWIFAIDFWIGIRLRSV
jgi:hypothetical protein